MRKHIIRIPLIGKWAYRQYVAVKLKFTFRGSASYWEMRYKNGGESGAGSRGRLAEFKAQTVNELLTRYEVSSLADFGCGDGFIAHQLVCECYTGFDISASAIERCKEAMRHQPEKTFAVYPPSPDFHAEACLSMDVILHLVEDSSFESYLNALFDSSTRFVFIYSSDFDEPAFGWVRNRKFTHWVRTHKPQWILKEVLQNPYPYDAKNHAETSPASFYIYSKSSSYLI
jgi:Methyltransferase domain